jgi:hypothetical protein
MPDEPKMDSESLEIGIMKTTVDIPEKELEDAMRYTKAKTKREAIVAAIVEFNRRRRVAELARHAGTCDTLMTVEELQRQRRKG